MNDINKVNFKYFQAFSFEKLNVLGVLSLKKKYNYINEN